MLDLAKAILGLDSSLKGLLDWSRLLDGELTIEYYSPNNEEFTERAVRVTRIWREQGRQYFEGYCRLRGGKRCFRVDRVISAAKAGKSKRC